MTKERRFRPFIVSAKSDAVDPFAAIRLRLAFPLNAPVWATWCGRRSRPRCLDRTRDTSVCFDLNFPIGDRTSDMTTRAKHQSVAADALILEPALHIHITTCSIAVEHAALSNCHILAV